MLPPCDCRDAVPSRPSTAISPPWEVRAALPFMVSRDPNVMVLLPVLTVNASVYATSTWMLPLQQDQLRVSGSSAQYFAGSHSERVGSLSEACCS